MEDKLIWMAIIILIMVIYAVITLISAILTYFLWNWLASDLFGLPYLTFWQAWGILWLATIFFKSRSLSSLKK